jgi:hypothetical protein
VEAQEETEETEETCMQRGFCLIFFLILSVNAGVIQLDQICEEIIIRLVFAGNVPNFVPYTRSDINRCTIIHFCHYYGSL